MGRGDRQARGFVVNGENYTRRQIAQFSGVAGFRGFRVRRSDSRHAVPQKVHGEISKSFHENLLIFHDANRTRSIWLRVKREKGKAEIA